MHNGLVRNSLILLIVLLFVISMKGKLINGLFAIWVGAWVMARIFKYLFNSENDTANLSVYEMVSVRYLWIHLLFESTRKKAFYILLWWCSGILTAFLTYQLLNFLLIPS